MRDRLGAFVPQVDVVIQGAVTGPLAGMTFAAKDLFDVRGFVTEAALVHSADPEVVGCSFISGSERLHGVVARTEKLALLAG